MADPHARKHAAVNRLRHQLKKKRESLADQFEFKMLIVFIFKDKKKKCALFQAGEVVPVMTNNYEDCIMKGVKEDAYSLESTMELLEKDVVQLHAPRYHSMRNDVFGCTQNMNFFLWPRNDIEKISCLLFSRWKDNSSEPFKPLQVPFHFQQEDYERQLMRLLARRERSGLIVSNPLQSMFLFVDRQQLQSAKNKAIVFNLSSICLYLPQDRLTHWGPGTMDDIVDSLMSRSPLTPAKENIGILL